MNVFPFIFYLVLYPQLVGSYEAQIILLARDTACVFSQLCPIFITICSTISFPTLQIVVLHSLESFYFKNSFHFFYLILKLQLVRSLEAQEIPLARDTAEIPVTFAQFLIQLASHFTFLYFKFVSHSLESLFSRIGFHLWVFYWGRI